MYSMIYVDDGGGITSMWLRVPAALVTQQQYY